ncbi:GtrA family protein [Endozoicomonas sp. OPT23]|uniref:GtrA family protein n=1 Tax=Endozoicomonas sp. OPT23 TaxID=2072845 RepID=UPI00129AC2F9|nr:GtrA family protein [Endozoicomonas sp. OPT23]MRI33772.1 GtrA family protein [Endozoicomonas sp. OPT23]
MQLIKFVVVGGSAAAVHLACLWALVQLAGFSEISSNALAFVVAFIVSYTGQSLWTFNHKQHDLKSSGLRFLIVQLFCSFVLNQGLYTLLISYTSLHYLLASFIVLASVPIVTFTLSKYWAFK